MATKEQAARYRYNKKITNLLALHGKTTPYSNGLTKKQQNALYVALQQAVLAFMPFTQRLGTAAVNSIVRTIEEFEESYLDETWLPMDEQIEYSQEIATYLNQWHVGNNLDDVELGELVEAIRLAECACDPFITIIGANNVAWLRVTLADLLSLQTRRESYKATRSSEIVP